MVAAAPSRFGPAVDQYLARHAEPEAALAPTLTGHWPRAVCVPMRGETDTWRAALEHLALAAGQGGGALLLLTVNAPVDAQPHHHAANTTLLADLLAALKGLRALAHDGRVTWAWLGRWGSAAGPGLDVVVLDRASEGRRLPAGQGVGLARKIGADLALALWRAGRVASPWVFHTDADALPPPDYLTAAQGVDPQSVAITLPFRHLPSPGQEGAVHWRALLLYEMSLRYFVLGLRWAGSPHAFHTVGSTLVVRADAYAAVRGFPRRAAAEDFYLLDKLSAIGPVATPAAPVMALQGRPSDRVPFGTGRAMTRIGEDLAQGRAFTLYHPRCFVALRHFLSALKGYAQGPDETAFFEALAADPATGAVVASLGGDAKLGQALARHAAQARGEALWRRLGVWFNSLRTLRAVHAVRDGGWPNLPWREALAKAPFTQGAADWQNVSEEVALEVAWGLENGANSFSAKTD